VPKSNGKTLLLLKPRGFCAGVVRAIDIVRIALEAFGPPIYVRKEIVHNRFVVEELQGKGAIFVDSVDEVPNGERVIYSAHGVSPEVRDASQARNLRVIDATCPLVTKVHVEAVKFARRVFVDTDRPPRSRRGDWNPGRGSVGHTGCGLPGTGGVANGA